MAKRENKNQRKKKPNKILFNIGVGMIILGSLLIVSSVFGLQQAFIGVDTPMGSINADGLSSASVTVIVAGFILVVLGAGIIGLAYKVGK